MSNSRKAVEGWAKGIVSRSSLPEVDKSVAAAVAIESAGNGGLRGDVSDALRVAGFSNEQFNFELFV